MDNTPTPRHIRDNAFFHSLVDADEFTITYELVPGQAAGGSKVDRLLEFAGRAAADGRIKALSITDNAGGHPALAPIALGSEIRRIGIEPLIHFSLKDKNRNQIKSHILLYHRRGFHSLLVMGGDFPRPGYYGQAKPVFDLDSVQTLHLFDDMREEFLDTGQQPLPESVVRQTPFFLGCVVSPFKTTAAEQVWQYEKLKCKLQAGAGFVITQLGYDLRKFDELIRFCRLAGLTVPLLANVFIPSLGVARCMLRGGVPGAMLSRELIATMEREARSPDRGEEARLSRAAGLVARLRQMGYAGVHLGGNLLDFDKIRFILDRAEEIHHHRSSDPVEIHFPMPGTWYYFKANLSPERNSDIPSPRRRPMRLRLAYLINSAVHHLLFSGRGPLGRPFRAFCLFCGRGKRRTRFLTLVERIVKVILFSCRMCGECTLAYSGYLCPQSGCPKNLLNGPCGGSRFGHCEVHPDRLCFYVRLAGRIFPPGGTTAKCGFNTLPPKDWSRDQSSSWINHFRR